MHRGLVWLVTVGVGTLACGVSYLVGTTDPLLTASVGLSYAVLARLTIAHPDVVYEEGSSAWAVGRWSGLATGFVLLVVLLGLGPTLPVEDDLRLSLQLLVFGAGWAMWVLGVAYARAKADDG